MNYQRFLRSVKWVKELPWLHILLFIISIGNADVLWQYLISTGSKDTWQLKAAIYATEMLVVWATAWGTIGLFISAVLFAVSMVSIHSVYPEHWVGHSGFSLAIFCGALGNWVRGGHWKDIAWIFTKKPVTKQRGRPKKKKV